MGGRGIWTSEECEASLAASCSERALLSFPVGVTAPRGERPSGRPLGIAARSPLRSSLGDTVSSWLMDSILSDSALHRPSRRALSLPSLEVVQAVSAHSRQDRRTLPVSCATQQYARLQGCSLHC